MKLFERFDKVYCISLPHRTDRRENFKKEVEKFDLGEFEFFEASYGKDLPNPNNLKLGAIGLVNTTIRLLNYALESNIKTIAIIEDDCCFDDEIKNIDKYYQQLPNDWDMLYYGGNHNFHWHAAPKPIKVSDNILKLQYTFSTQFVVIKDHLYKPIIDELSSYSEAIDVQYTKFQKTKNVYAFYPSIAKQSPSYSDIENIFVNYDYLIK